ncbi:MAG: hypothetical protein Q9187_007753 [Circinaria calcarea]
MQKVVTFPNDEEGEKYAKSSLRLDHVVDLEGYTLGTSLKIPDNIILQHWLYNSRDPDSQTGGQYTGNEYANFDQLYNTRNISLVEAFSRMQKLHMIRQRLHSFRKGFSSNNASRFDEHQVEYLACWIRDRVTEALESIQEAYSQDAAALIEISKEYDDKIFEEL